jgi:hypothetical protein
MSFNENTKPGQDLEGSGRESEQLKIASVCLSHAG